MELKNHTLTPYPFREYKCALIFHELQNNVATRSSQNNSKPQANQTQLSI